MTKRQTAIIGLVVVAGLATFLMIQHQSQVQLREENESLRRQIAQLRSDNEGISNRLSQATTSFSESSDSLRELLRLRGEVGLLRRQQRDLQRVAAQSNASGQHKVDAEPQPNIPAPFQLRIVLDGPGEDSEPMTNNASGAKAETVHVQKTPLLDSTAISSAIVTTNLSTGTPQIDVEFSEAGKQLFAEITKENINKRLAIVLGGHLYSAPVIRSEISAGKAQIDGEFTAEEARQLAAKITEAVAIK
jgi:preprotein translocase subunit SecD